MKLNFLRTGLISLMLTAMFSCSSSNNSIEREVDFNFDWKFTELADTTTLTSLPLDDSKWKDIRLPHDWSVEHSFNKDLEGCTGYLPGGVGVYQKDFITPEDKDLKSTFILFDGVYNNAKFWLNGTYIGENPYGYSPTYFNLTEVLNPVGKENTLTVYVDHSHYADSRWYTGSGIYRDVKLITVDKLHIPIWGVFVTTPKIEIAENGKSATKAVVDFEVTVENENTESKAYSIETQINDLNGKEVASTTKEYNIEANSSSKFNQVVELTNAKLWDTETPNLYNTVTSVIVDGKVVDQYRTKLGIRELVFDKDKGFFLNGKSTYAKGVCLHHDAGLVGSAVPRGVWERRLKLLKEGGVNAVRTSHNPFSDEFLEICDELGILVQSEIFDEMENPKDKRFNFEELEPLYRTEGYHHHFPKWGESDLKRTIYRDRNHASVFMYSIGNETEWTFPEYMHVSGLFKEGRTGYWNAIPKLTPAEMRARYEALPPQKHNLVETSKRLVKWIKELDTTRPVTANQIIPVASAATGFSQTLDVVSISYQIAQYGWLKEHYPNMMFTGGENTGLLQEWKSITENPMVFSMYMWTGIDYLGESNGRWPQKAWPGDMLDLAAFTKAGFNHFKAIWNSEPMIALQTHKAANSEFDIQNGEYVNPAKVGQNWSNYLSEPIWNYNNDEKVIVEIVTNQPEAELILNGKSLGSKKLADCPDNIMRWVVPFAAGKLEAKTIVNGKELITELNTASEPSAIAVEVDNNTLTPNGYDVAHIVAQLVDKDGNKVLTKEAKITFEIKGDATLLGVDNGSNSSTQDFQASSVETHLGRCLAIIQSKRDKAGKVEVIVSCEGMEPQSVIVEIE